MVKTPKDRKFSVDLDNAPSRKAGSEEGRADRDLPSQAGEPVETCRIKNKWPQSTYIRLQITSKMVLTGLDGE